jgi:DNA-binding response OmpR family regulator
MDDLTSSRQTPGDAPQPDGPRRTSLLVVEDDRATAIVLGRVLQKAGYEVATAGTVRTAVDAARERQFHVVISDLGLPDGSGLDLLSELRTLQPSIKAIALSGYGTESDVRSSQDAGFSEHLVKPVDLASLEAAVQRVANGGPG